MHTISFIFFIHVCCYCRFFDEDLRSFLTLTFTLNISCSILHLSHSFCSSFNQWISYLFLHFNVLNRQRTDRELHNVLSLTQKNENFTSNEICFTLIQLKFQRSSFWTRRIDRWFFERNFLHHRFFKNYFQICFSRFYLLCINNLLDQLLFRCRYLWFWKNAKWYRKTFMSIFCFFQNYDSWMCHVSNKLRRNTFR